MEFQYRAGDERSRSPPPCTGAAAASASSGSADGHGGDGGGHHGENSEAVERPAPPWPPASDPDELRRRQAAKESIRERILREEAETLVLEAEVRLELMEERIPFLRSGLAGTYAGGSEGTAAAPAGMMADSPSPIALEVLSTANASAALPARRKSPDVAAVSTVSATTNIKKQKPDLTCTVCGITTTGENAMRDHLKGKSHRKKTAALAQPMPKAEVRSIANGSAALPAKRKNPDAAAASTSSASTSSKMQKLDLTCTVCGITSTGEKAMQDHLKGKIHRRKAAAAVAQPMPEAAEHEEQEEEGGGGYTPTKLTMLTNAGTMHEVTQMNGFVLCEVCDVRTADRVTMMCHLEGSKHASKAQQEQQCCEPPAEAPAVSTAAAAGGGPGTVAAVEVNGVPHTVRRVYGGSLLCELCDVKVPSESVMRSHLTGKKHTNKAMSKDAGDSESVVVDVSGVQHVQKVDGFLLCACCDVKAPSDCVMKSHLAGKKHKDKAKAVAVHVGAGGTAEAALVAEAKSNEACAVAGTGHRTQGNGTVKGQAAGDVVPAPPAAPEGDAAPALAGTSMAPMEVDEHAEVGDATAKAEEENAAAEVVVGLATATQGKEPVRIHGAAAAAVPAQEVKIQVEGKECTVLRRANGTLSCELCGVDGCDKDGMLRHLYTRAHWGNARRLAQEKAEKAAAAAARRRANNGGSGGDGIPLRERLR